MKPKLPVLLVAATICAFGGERANDTYTRVVMSKLGELGKASAMARRASPGAKADAYYSGSGVRLVVAADVTIQPGDVFNSGEVPIDFGGAENLAIAVTSPSDLTAMGIGVTWAAPGEYFTFTDLIMGTDLVAPQTSSGASGGSRVPVYGTALRLLVVNGGTKPITIRQLSVYACIR